VLLSFQIVREIKSDPRN